MNSTLFKNQIAFVIVMLFTTLFCIFGISTARAFVQNVDLEIETSRLVRPVKNYYDYRLALAESSNQTILQTILNKNVNTTSSMENAHSIPVVVYHGIVDKADGRNATIEQVKEQLYGLHNAGYKTVSLEDYVLFTQGQKELPEKSFLLTFDDGRKDSLKVDPVLKALNYQAIMFVITSKIGSSEYYLSMSELKSMQNSNRWNIQSHGHNAHDQYVIDQDGNKGNFYSNKLWLINENRLETTEEFTSRVHNDLAESKRILEEEGFNVTTIAFPFGDFGQFTKNFPEAESIVMNLSNEMYTISFYQQYKKQISTFERDTKFNSNQAFAKRITISPDNNKTSLVQLFEGGKTKTMPFQDNFTNSNQWETNWGLSTVQNNELLVSSTDKTTGGAAFLVGSSDWKNYRLDASVQWLMGDTFTIHTRVYNANNFLTCDFSGSQVQIRSKINGQTKVLASKKITEAFDPAGAKLSIEVKDNTISCFINDKEIIATTLKDIPFQNGGIGFSTWDKELGNSAILINNLAVKELQ